MFHIYGKLSNGRDNGTHFSRFRKLAEQFLFALNYTVFRFVCCMRCWIRPSQDVQHKPALFHYLQVSSEWHAARAKVLLGVLEEGILGDEGEVKEDSEVGLVEGEILDQTPSH